MITRIGTVSALGFVAVLAMARPAQAVGEFVWPNSGQLTATHVYPNGAYHNGSADIAAGYWVAIGASRGGTAYPFRDYYGANCVQINHESGYATLYCHMVQWPNVYSGQSVGTNQHIGYVGSTGWSTGPHCHYAIYRYGVRLIIPGVWIGEWVNRGYWVPGTWSGLSGAVSSTPRYMVNVYGVNVRTGPGTGYAIVGSLGYGAVVNVYENYYGWYKIIYGGYYRWIAGWYMVRV